VKVDKKPGEKKTVVLEAEVRKKKKDLQSEEGQQ
jgi:hypothetical protein